MTNTSARAGTRGFRKGFVAATGLAISAVLALTGCATSGADAAVSEEDRVDGGELTIYNANIKTLDPRQNHGIVGRALADSLIDVDPDTGEFTPWLAESWTVSDDATTFTFQLRDGVTFSDGTPLTGEVVKTNLDESAKQIGDGKGWYFQGLFDHYVGTEATGEHEATVTFSEPNHAFLPTLATVQLAIEAPASFEKSYDERKNGDFIGSGPYVLENYTPNESVTLTRRADYDWASGVATHSGAASIETINIKFVDEQSVRESALQSGEADIAQNPTNEGADQLEAQGYGLNYRAQSGIPYSLVLNFTTPALQDINVRRALSSAIDRTAIVDGITGPRQPVAQSVLTPSTSGFADQSALLGYDLDKSNRLLDEAGWVAGSDGIRAKDGERLSLDLVLWWEPQEIRDSLQLLKEQTARAGIEINIIEEIGANGDTWQSGKADLHLNNATRADGGLALYSQYTNENFEAASLITDVTFPGTLDSFTESGKLSEIVTQQITEPDLDTRNELLAEAQAIIVGDAIRIPIFTNINSESGFFASSDKVHGLRNNSLSELVLYDAWKQQ